MEIYSLLFLLCSCIYLVDLQDYSSKIHLFVMKNTASVLFDLVYIIPSFLCQTDFEDCGICDNQMKQYPAIIVHRASISIEIAPSFGNLECHHCCIWPNIIPMEEGLSPWNQSWSFFSSSADFKPFKLLTVNLLCYCLV